MGLPPSAPRPVRLVSVCRSLACVCRPPLLARVRRPFRGASVSRPPPVSVRPADSSLVPPAAPRLRVIAPTKCQPCALIGTTTGTTVVRVAAACADLRRLGAGAALGGLYGAVGCAAALQALDIACGAVCGVLASVTPGPATGAAEVDARRALRRRLEAIAESGGDDAATARTAAARLAPPRPPPPPKRRRSAVTDLILGS